MTKHQLRLHGSKKNRAAVDDKRIDEFLEGRTTLREAIKVTPEHLADLRAQAHAFYDAAKWERCIDVVLALAALDDIEPFDAVIIARAYTELGDEENAAIWGSSAERMLTDLQLILREMRGETGKRTIK
jgi:hypothetical protein